MKFNPLSHNNNDDGGGKTKALVRFFCGDITSRDVRENIFQDAASENLLGNLMDGEANLKYPKH